MLENQENNHVNFTKEDALQSLASIQSWITAMDSKASYAITFVGVLIGFMLGSEDRKFDITKFICRIKIVITKGPFNWSEFLFFVLCICSFISILCFLEVLVARIKNTKEPKSNFFFGTIGSRDFATFKRELLTASDAMILDDLLSQIHINSQICNKKAKWYNRGHKCLIITVIIWFVVAICKV